MDEFEKATEAFETEVTDSVSTAQPDEITEENISDFAETTEVTAESKKPFILQKTIIIACCIFLSAVVVFGGFQLITILTKPGLEGIWLRTKIYYKGMEAYGSATGDSAKEAAYFQFEPDGDFYYTEGTSKETLKWSYTDKKGKFVSGVTEYFVIYPEGRKKESSLYSWKTEGSLFSEKKLVFESTSEQPIVNELKVYEGSKIPEYKLKPNKDFKAVKEILGKWTNNNDLTFEFNDDGSFELIQSKVSARTGLYTVNEKKKTISLSYVKQGQDVDTGAMPYKLKNGKLTFSNVVLTKEK